MHEAALPSRAAAPLNRPAETHTLPCFSSASLIQMLRRSPPFTFSNCRFVLLERSTIEVIVSRRPACR